MTENNITVNMENLSQNERDILLNLIEKANGKSKVWKPTEKETYWLIGNRKIDYYDFENDSVDKFLYSIGNCFKTEEEAKFALEKQKVVTELKRFALENNEHEIDWDDGGQKKYEIYYDIINEKVDVNWWYAAKRNIVHFSSEAIAKRAIKTIGEDRLKKYYFEIGE